MAFYPELKGNPLAARQRALTKILETAKRELNLQQSDLVIRPLRPDDIIANNAGTWKSLSIATTRTELINKDIADNTFISIYGVALRKGTRLGNASPVSLIGGSIDIILTQNEIQEMKITRKGSVARFWDLTPIPAFESEVGYVDDPFTVDQNTNIKIELVATTTTILDQDKYAILGDVVEKRGLLINP